MPESNENQDPIDQLRARADQAGELEKNNAQLLRQLAFARAGISDTEEGPGKYLFNGYDGELTPDAIKAEALKLGIGAVEPPTPPVVTADDKAAHVAASDLGGEVPPTTDLGPSPQVAGLGEFREALKRGDTRQDAAAFFVDRVVGAAASGDERVILTPRRD